MENYKKDKQDIANAYSEKAATYTSGVTWQKKDGESINSFLATVKKGAKLLSIGSGRGELEGYVADRGFDITGIDSAPGMVELAKSRFPNAEFAVMDADEIKFSQDSFDAVISRYMSQHVRLEGLLEQIKLVVKPSGKIWLMLHTANEESTELEFGWDDVKQKAKMWLPSSSAANEIIEKSGLKIIQTKSYPDRSKLMNDELYILEV